MFFCTFYDWLNQFIFTAIFVIGYNCQISCFLKSLDYLSVTTFLAIVVIGSKCELPYVVSNISITAYDVIVSINQNAICTFCD